MSPPEHLALKSSMAVVIWLLKGLCSWTNLLQGPALMQPIVPGERGEAHLAILKHQPEKQASHLTGTHLRACWNTLEKHLGDGDWWAPSLFFHHLYTPLLLWYSQQAPSSHTLLHSRAPVSPGRQLLYASDALIFVAASQGTPLDCLVQRPGDLVFQGPMGL